MALGVLARITVQDGKNEEFETIFFKYLRETKTNVSVFLCYCRT